MTETIHLRINDPNALMIIESLEKMGAIDFLGEDDDDVEISDEMKTETRKRLEHLKNNPQTAISLQQFKAHIQQKLADN